MGLLWLGLRCRKDLSEVRADNGNLNTQDLRQAPGSLDPDPATAALDVAQHAGRDANTLANLLPGQTRRLDVIRDAHGQKLTYSKVSGKPKILHGESYGSRSSMAKC